MTTNQHSLTSKEAFALVENALGSDVNIFKWLKGHFGRFSGMTRAELEKKLNETLEAWRKRGVYPTPPNDGREDDELTLSR